MADYYKLAKDCIESVQNIVNGPSETPLQLNEAQCKTLAQELAELGVYLQGQTTKFKVGQDSWRIAILHVYSVIKRAELLVRKCCCKNSESWVVAAMTLVEIQEDFAGIILDLHQWRLVLEYTITSAMGATSEEKVELLMIIDEEYQELYLKLRRSNHVLQEAAAEDKEKIVLKLAEVQASENSLEHLCALHLQSWLAQTEDETHKPDLNVVQKLVEHETGPLLGMGGCGAVLRVKWLGVACALKKLNVRDEREATALKGLLHPNIIRLYLYWEDLSENPKSNLLMELMDMDLSVYIKSRLKDMGSSSSQQSGESENIMPFSLPVAIDIMLQVAQALRYMHDRHLTHRDLKTSNILVRRLSESLNNFQAEGYLEIKLADFGLAKTYDNTSTSIKCTVNTGTKRYAAPEIFGKDLATERNFPPMADVWSFGVTCSEILSGKEPYANESLRTLHTRIAKGNLRPTLPKVCPEYLAFIIRSCWELQPKRRPDFTSVCRMLRHAKLLSLGVTKLDDSRSFMAYITRRNLLKTLRNPRSSQVGITLRFASLLKLPFKYFKIPSNTQVRKSPNAKSAVPGADSDLVEKPQLRSKEYYSAAEDRSKLVFFDDSSYSFDLEDLLGASAEMLGKGSVGTAYKAILDDGTIMAVRRLKDVTTVKKEFEAQIQVVGKMRHRNLVPLRAYYFSTDEQLLVYDFMHMGSLSALLHDNRSSTRTPLNWAARVEIATGAARGLAHLHAQGGPKSVHANIKSSNILLDRDLNACISDFGLAQLLTSSFPRAKIIGYRAPEVTMLRNVTKESDVYSFGVLLLELLTGRAPTQAALNDEAIDLPQLVQSISREDWTTKVFDAELLPYDTVEGEMVNLLQIAMRCVDPVPNRRPTMSDVQLLLEDVRPISMHGSDEITSRQSVSPPEESQFRTTVTGDNASRQATPSHPQTSLIVSGAMWPPGDVPHRAGYGYGSW